MTKSRLLLAASRLVFPLAAHADASAFRGASTHPALLADKAVEWKVVTKEGELRVQRNGKLVSRIFTKFPDVRGWKFLDGKAEIVVKSGQGRKPGLVELFDVKTGKRLDKIKATDVKNGKPAWAKNFAE